MSLFVAVDTGGTFTDLVARAPGGDEVRLKVPSTPHDPAVAIANALDALRKRVPGTSIAELRHGTTVATNALLERRGARVGLITNAGFEDILRLRRQARDDLYALHPSPPPPLVEPRRCFGIKGRIDADGEVVLPLEDLDAWLEKHRQRLEACDAFAVCMLHAWVNDHHESEVARALRGALPDTMVSVSSELVPLAREYERASTVAVNAYVAPIMGRYLSRLEDTLSGIDLLVMDSAGGLMAPRRAGHQAVHTVLSGPAGGVRGAWMAGQRAGCDALLSLDMGGTSADISFIRAALQPEQEGRIGEHPLRIALLPIETIGAGGGSIAWIDAGGALRVGPRSAGADPGPACYGRAGPGAEPTVTDANVVLGRIERLLGGEMTLDDDAARTAVGRLADALGATVEETALAIVRVAEASMARTCKRVTMERGIDPRELTLVAFGGAGGLHGCAIADELGCRDVLFPAEPGVLSADGILVAPREIAVTRALLLDESLWSDDELRQRMTSLGQEARTALAEELRPGPSERDIRVELTAEVRYRGQSYSLPIDVHTLLDAATPGAALRHAFDRAHELRYGYALTADHPAELVSLRAFAREADRAAPTAALPTDETHTGPASVASYSATLWVPEGWQATRLDSGDIRCQRHGEATPQRVRQQEALELEIHRQRLSAIAEEMGAALMRSSFSANIKERRDFSCALFDGHGRMLVQAAHIPVHLGSQPLSVQAALAAVEMRPGTTVLLNDPYAGGTHLPDVTLVAPVYLDDTDPEPTFFVANRAHHADIGGIAPGSMPSAFAANGTRRPLTIDDEGWRSPPTLLTEELRESFARASRTPAERVGDLRAQEAANHVGANRLRHLCATLSRETVERRSDALLDYSERRMRAMLSTLPDGRYEFTDHLDDDGFGEQPIPIPVVVEITGDCATVDFTAAPDQHPGSINAVRAISVSAAFYVFRCLGGDEVVANAGLLRPIRVLTRPGSICDAVHPAAVSAGNVETSQRLVDALFGALAQAAPDRVPAASCGSMNNVLFGGIDERPGPRHGIAYVHYETLGGGAGASAIGPGADAIHVHMTNTLNTPVEELERAFPVQIESYSVRGQAYDASPAEIFHRGGAGIIRAYRFVCPADVTIISERRRFGPWSIGTEARGQRGANTLIRADGTVHQLPGKVTVRVEPGDLLRIETPGGGHFSRSR